MSDPLGPWHPILERFMSGGLEVDPDDRLFVGHEADGQRAKRRFEAVAVRPAVQGPRPRHLERGLPNRAEVHEDRDLADREDVVVAAEVGPGTRIDMAAAIGPVDGTPRRTWGRARAGAGRARADVDLVDDVDLDRLHDVQVLRGEELDQKFVVLVVSRNFRQLAAEARRYKQRRSFRHFFCDASRKRKDSLLLKSNW
jgi:hypothetical protein